MTPLLIVDDFLPSFEALRIYADTAKFGDVVNPVDGGNYPGIDWQVPQHFVDEFAQQLAFVGFNAEMVQHFLRLSLKGYPVHNQAHTDVLTGDWTVLVYMNRPEHCAGGTALLSHVDGMKENPHTEPEVEVWKRDSNTPEKWNVEFMCPMKTNRAFIYPAKLFHRAEPIGGFGDSPENGRLVLTAFLKNKEN